jgi:hypothetical protein
MYCLFLCCSVCCLFLCRSAFFVCKCVLYNCHRVATQLQLTNISISINIKIPNDPTGNRIRDLLACSAVPQPSGPTRKTIWPSVQTINEIFTHEKYCTARCPLVLTNNATKLQNERTRTGILSSFPLCFLFHKQLLLIKAVIIWV